MESEQIEVQATGSSSMHAIFSSSPVDVDSLVTIDGEERKVENARKIVISYNPRRNIVVVRGPHGTISDKKRLEKFAATVGIYERGEFIRKLFIDPTFVGGVAQVERYYVEFEKPFFQFR